MSEPTSDPRPPADASAQTRPPSDAVRTAPVPGSFAEAVARPPSEQPPAAEAELSAPPDGPAPGWWARLRLWTCRPERVRDAGVVVIFIALTSVSSLLSQGYSLLRFLSDPDASPVRAGLLAGVVALPLGIAVRLWLGCKMIARRPWALWSALVLQVLVIGFLILNTWTSIGRLQTLEQLGMRSEVAHLPDTTSLYVRLLENLLYNLVPLLACCLAVRAYYCNRDPLRGTPRPGAWAAALAGLLLLATASGWDAVRGGDRRRPDVEHLGGTRLVYAVDEGAARTTPYQIEEVASVLRQRVGSTGARYAGVRALDGRQVEVSIPHTGKDHEDTVHRIKELLAWNGGAGGGLEFRILANRRDDWPALDLARAYFARARTTDGSERRALLDAAWTGRSPAPPEANGKPFIGTATIVAEFTYSWVQVGRPERMTLGLDSAYEFQSVPDPERPGQTKLVPWTDFIRDPAYLAELQKVDDGRAYQDMEKHLFWHQVAVARGEERLVTEEGPVPGTATPGFRSGSTSKTARDPLPGETYSGVHWKFERVPNDTWPRLLAAVRDRYKLPAAADFKEVPEGKVHELARRVHDLLAQEQKRAEPVEDVLSFLDAHYHLDAFQTLDLPAMGDALLYSRRVPAPARPSRVEPNEQVEYFLLTRDSPKDKEVTGLYLQSAQRGRDAAGRLAVSFRLNQAGGDRFYELTSQNAPDRATGFKRFLAILLDNQIISAPSLNAKIHSEAIVEGNFTPEEVDRYVALLSAKPLPVRLKPAPSAESTVPPTFWKKLSWALGPAD